MIRSRRVLVVEDDSDTSRLVAELLCQEFGVSVGIARDGQDGIAAAEREAFDLILLDLQLPTVSGFEVLRTLKANPRTAGIPVLAVTASSVDATLKALESGCTGFVHKPFDLDELLTVVRTYVDAPTRVLVESELLPLPVQPV